MGLMDVVIILGVIEMGSLIGLMDVVIMWVVIEMGVVNG